MDSSRRLLVLAVAGLVILLPLAAFGLLLFPPDFLYSHSSTYTYTTSISTNETISNATFHLPFPTEESEVGEVDDMWIYDDDGNQLSDWESAVVDTEHGPMLRLHAERLEGETNYILYTYAPSGSLVDREEIGPDEIPEDMTNKELAANPTTYHVAWRVTVDHEIETRHPIGNASFLTPVNDVTAVECQHPWDDTDACYTFSSVTGASFEADDSATVTIGEISFDGTNEWGFWLSNSFNTFEATTAGAIYTDDRQGWTIINGQLHAGIGRYDDPSR